jgi:thiamine-phosphate pyrophosphorylase
MDQPEAKSQLYLIIPPDLDQEIAVNFAESSSLGNIACALLRSGPTGKVDHMFARTLLRFSRFSNVPLLFENDAEAVAELGADGVHIKADEETYTQARSIVGDDLIVGVDCGLSRHDALTLAEMGADYIAFSDNTGKEICEARASLEELIIWWSETLIVPCVAWEMWNMEMAHLLAEAGADFVALSDPLWSHPKGPAAAADEFNTRLAEYRVPA